MFCATLPIADSLTWATIAHDSVISHQGGLRLIALATLGDQSPQPVRVRPLDSCY